MRAPSGLILALAVLLCGCASVPLSTVTQLSALDSAQIVGIDPAEVRVEVSVPIGYEINTTASRLTLKLTAASGETRSAVMPLSLLQTTREARSGGLFAPDVAVSSYLMALSSEARRQLRGLQQFIASGQAQAFRFNVSAPISGVPPKARGITFWVDLKLSSHEPFMPLIDGAEVEFEGTAIGNP